MTIQATWRCPFCKHNNPHHVNFCANCGSTRPEQPTREVSGETVRQASVPLFDDTRLPANALALHVAGRFKPFVITFAEGQDQIVLGREGTEENLVDLSAFNAQALGVSRRHAIITRQASERETTYLLEDLGSTNGTFLNGEQLPPNIPTPIDQQSEIRLGHLFLFIELPSNDPVEVRFRLQERAGSPAAAPRPLTTMHALSPQVRAFLQAIAALQTLLDEAQSFPAADFIVKSLHLDEQQRYLTITTQGGGQVIHLLRTIVSPWRQTQAKHITRFWQQAATSPTTAAPDSQLAQAEAELAGALLEAIGPALPAEAHETLRPAIQPVLRKLALSPLEVMA